MDRDEINKRLFEILDQAKDLYDSELRMARYSQKLRRQISNLIRDLKTESA